MDSRGSWLTSKLSPGIEFLVVSRLPALLCHFLGCVFLVLYYRYAHTWRDLNKEIDAAQIQVEVPYWEEEVEYIYKAIFKAFLMASFSGQILCSRGGWLLQDRRRRGTRDIGDRPCLSVCGWSCYCVKRRQKEVASYEMEVGDNS